ncbi:MAG: hypothetical protein Q9211_000429 [Gyalolechia sp. 1 TL-2023]
MATLNTSTNGPAISKNYQSIINTPTTPASKSSTHGQWAVFSVSAPLANAFQPDTGSKESVLKVQSTGDGNLADLVDEFSDGKIQFAFVRVNDPNTTLPKFVLIAWCGEGVPERTKGYFTSHVAAVSKILHGYHVQVTARSERDLTPESIVQKVSDASGSKYSSNSGGPASYSGSQPPVSSKPAFTPTQSSRGTSSFNPLASSRPTSNAPKNTGADDDGWGQDAPPVTRTGLEKVQSSYQPTKVNMRELSSQKADISPFSVGKGDNDSRGEVVKGAYQPVGKVDIAALRRQAKEAGNGVDDRPNVVKGSYEPVGQVDIAALRARAQQPSERETPSSTSPATTGASSRSTERSDEQKSVPNRATPSTSSERLTSLPKPKVANLFAGGSASFAGTRAPVPVSYGLESKPTASTPTAGVGRTFAEQGGKTPAQLWAEKKARERGVSGASDTEPPATSRAPTSPNPRQSSGGGEWKSGYAGKSWAPVQTTRTGQSANGIGEHRTGEEIEAQEEDNPAPAGGIGAIRDRFKDTPPMGAASVDVNRSAPSPPPLDTSNKPNAGCGIPIPGLQLRPLQTQPEDEKEARMPTPPPQPPRSPTPPTPPAISSGSPIRVAMPVARSQYSAPDRDDARGEQFSPPAMPTRSLAQQIPQEEDLTDEPSRHDPARGAGEAAAAATFGEPAVEPSRQAGGKCALVQFDYEKAEDNEIDLTEGEHVTNIDMVDEDWWMGENSRGEVGLFPSNYVELVADDDHGAAAASTHTPALVPDHGSQPEPTKHMENSEADQGHTAVALYDYDAAEDNELSFPENAKITGIVSSKSKRSGF